MKTRSGPVHPARIPLRVFLLGLMAFAFAIPALLVSVYTVARFRMPYNEEGNHFDGIVVHHAGSEYFYAVLSAALWALVVLAGVLARRALRRAHITH